MQCADLRQPTGGMTVHSTPRFAATHLVCLSWALAVACAPCTALAQGALTAKLAPQGTVTVLSGETVVATLSLNAHGPEWAHVDQPAATASAADAQEGGGRVTQGTLPVPNTDEGAIRFWQTIIPTPNGLSADYLLGATQPLALNGLHVSLLLPVETLSGKTIAVWPLQQGAPAEEPEEIAVPAQLDTKQWQLFSGPASKVVVCPGTDDAITIVPTAFEPNEVGAGEPPVFFVQDLRRWDHDQVEVRLSLVNADNGQWLTAWDKLHIAVDVTFARGLSWE